MRIPVLIGLAIAWGAASLVAQRAGCRSANTGCTTGFGAGNNNFTFAIHVPVDPAAKTVLGFDFYTRTLAGAKKPAIVPISLYLGSAVSGPAGNPVATGTMVVGQRLKWYAGRFTRPVPIRANRQYFLVHTSVDIDHSACRMGTPVPYHYRDPSSRTWRGVFRLGWVYKEHSSACAWGSYGEYGTGCEGSVRGGGCNAKNMGCTLGSRFGSYNEIALHEQAPGPISIQAVKLRAVAPRGTATIPIRIYRDNNGSPGVLAGSTTMTVGTTYGTYMSAPFNPAVAIGANQRYYVSYASTQGNYIHEPLCTLGARRYTGFHFRPPNSTRWGPGRPQPWAYEVVCRGGPRLSPDLDARTLPVLGTVFHLAVDRAAPRSPASLVFGGSRARWGTLKLPFRLDPYGAPGCSILASPDIALGGATSATGSFGFRFTLPNDTALNGRAFYNQGVVLDRGANALNIAVTEGGMGTVGPR